MSQRVEHNPLEAAFAALLDHGLDGAGEAHLWRDNLREKTERVNDFDTPGFVI